MLRAGFVLVGGRSSRMGRDKARLPVNNRLLVEDVAEKVCAVAGNVTLVGQPERYRDLNLASIDDLQPQLGPLSGIEAALRESRSEMNLIVACDMPGIESNWLEKLMIAAASRGDACTVCRDAAGEVHPLCGVWRRDSLPVIQGALTERRLRVMDVLAELRAGYLDLEHVLDNVNTPDDWMRWQTKTSEQVAPLN